MRIFLHIATMENMVMKKKRPPIVILIIGKNVSANRRPLIKKSLSLKIDVLGLSVSIVIVLVAVLGLSVSIVIVLVAVVISLLFGEREIFRRFNNAAFMDSVLNKTRLLLYSKYNLNGEFVLIFRYDELKIKLNDNEQKREKNC
ncbi:hypothetical protein BpHYR1_044564 [Brachionus plicatilis]|uniref:Uncharacterized protein n=1 Tax=Brachionus plicatilis TaxID=10195 RepID=A0A3M7R149_BRAPC|nr:hypothetical protein BpHYR1_044564 [Brachionus plicatilis]